MNIKIDIDCTPAEARAFFGLPDVAAMQEAVMKEIQEQMMANLKGLDAETLFKTWLPAGMQGLEQMQKAFWGQMGGAAQAPKEKD